MGSMRMRSTVRPSAWSAFVVRWPERDRETKVGRGIGVEGEDRPDRRSACSATQT